MFWITVAGTTLLVLWVLWVLYIVNPQSRVTLSLVLKVEHLGLWLDPFLRTIYLLLDGVDHLTLLEVWVVSVDSQQSAYSVMQRLQAVHPRLIFQYNETTSSTCTYLPRASGQMLWVFDLIDQNTPLTVLQALEQLVLQAGPSEHRSLVLDNSPI